MPFGNSSFGCGWGVAPRDEGGTGLDIFLPVAGVSLNAFVLVGVGALVGFLSGLLGVGGGFLLTPLLIMFGIDPLVAVATGTNAIVGASTSGTLAHLRAKNVDVKLGMIMLAGGVLGGGAGTVLLRILRQEGNADVVIVFSYVVLLALMGGLMFVEGLTSQVRGDYDAQRKSGAYRMLARLPFRMRFPVSDIETSAFAPFVLGIAVGVLAAVMGVGGGFFLIPAMTYFLAVPMRIVVGTSLFQMLFTSASVTILQAALNHSVDVVLAVGLLIGATLGAQVGASLAGRLRGDQLKIVLSLLVLALSIKMFNDLLLMPVSFLTLPGAR